MELPKFSVLMSVYLKDDSVFLKKSLDSIIAIQTKKPDQVILVRDGKIKSECQKIISEYENNYPDLIRVIKIENNEGLANALNVGVKYCKYDLIARMDADDICLPDRFEKQLKYFLNNNVDILGGQIQEFSDDESKILSIRNVPLLHDDMVSFMKFRSPFSHPSIMFKKNILIKVNGYDTSVFPEDYDFFVRAFLSGAKFANLNDILLKFRLGANISEVLRRRHGYDYAKKELKLFIRFYNLGFYSFFDLLKNIFIKLPLRIIPFTWFKFAYSFSRKNKL